jgi:hypothetical protein
VIPTIGFPSDGAELDAGPFTISGTGAPGSTIEVLDGATVIGTATVAADGTWSFQVAPGAGSTSYGVRPAGAATTPNQVRVTVRPAQAACTALAVACDAWVTRARGLRLRLRDAVGLQGQVLAMLPPGTRVTLLDGPQPADGFTWWRARTPDGREGWVAGEELRLQPD